MRRWRQNYLTEKDARELDNSLKTFMQIEKQVREHEKKHALQGNPIVLMNVSSRITDMSFNAATELLLGWALRLDGQKVIYMKCDHGLPHCHMGTSWQQPYVPPPCKDCQKISNRIYPQHLCREIRKWDKQYDDDLVRWLAVLEKTEVYDLKNVCFEDLKLGELVWPSLKWSFRMGNPARDPASAWFMARYIVGAAQLSRDFKGLIGREHPRAVVVFNGISYPEAVISIIARQHGIPVITYETGYLEGSIFFSHEQATKYEVDIPDTFRMGDLQENELSEYLSRRFQGNFTMAGVKFWQDIKGIEPELLNKISAFKQVVPVYTNVIFDTSQEHANASFNNMFEWLESTMQITRDYPDTLFIVRAHPDEARDNKTSREPVSQWMQDNGWLMNKNIHFIGPSDYVSSYELIKLAKFVLIYNSRIGLEAAMLGKTVVSGGLTGYQNSGAVIFPDRPETYKKQTIELLVADSIAEDAQRIINARRHYYYTMFCSCMRLGSYLGTAPSVSKLGFTDINKITPKNSKEIDIILRGILDNQPFTYC